MLLTGPGSGGPAGELPLDLAEVPVDAVERAVDVGAGQPPRLADLPDQQQRERLAVLAHLRDGGGHPGLALVEVDLAPGLVLPRGLRDRGHGVVVVDPRRALDRRAVEQA